MTEYTVKILIIGMPGILCYFLTQKLFGKKDHPTTETVLLVFLYAVLSYGLVGTIEAFVNFRKNLGFTSDTFDIFLGKKQDIGLEVLIKGILSGALLAYLISYCVHFNVANKVGQLIHATKRYGDEDVWHYFHNAPDSQKNGGWVFVRDLKKELVYYGYISTWSDSGKDRELILSDVSVSSNESGNFLYSMDHIYISCNKDDIMIEVPPSDAEHREEFRTNNQEREQ